MALKSGRVGIHPSQVDPITGMLIAGPGGTTDYTQLTNKPQINNVTLTGNKSLSDLGIATSFDTLTDSAINNPEVGQTLIYNGTGWENEFSSISPTTLSALQDVQITDPEVGQTLIYNGEGWENEFSSISSTTLSALQDVQITDPEDGAYLVYDAENSKWINSTTPPAPVVPEGSTVTPTDDIQTWLACAGITDKTYTTLNEVLADTTTLLALMSDNNAVDYLVRSTTWASNSALVPIMTDNTTPSGECFGTTPNASNTDCYKAFDGDDSISYYSPNISGANVYIGYDFGVETSVSLVRVVMSSGQGVPVSFKIQGSNTSKTDGYTDISSEVTLSNNEDRTFSLTATSSYRYYRLYVTNISAGRPYVKTIQFYPLETSITANSTAMTDIGANNYCANTLLDDATWCDAICNSTYFESVLNTKVPTMTSDTTPSGQVWESGHFQSDAGWKAFDGDDNSYWNCLTLTNGYVGYVFTSAVVVKGVQYKSLLSTNNLPKTITIKGSNDGTNFTDLKTYNATQTTGTFTIDLSDNNTAYTHYGFYVTEAYASTSFVVNSLQFYGRQDI